VSKSAKRRLKEVQAEQAQQNRSTLDTERDRIRQIEFPRAWLEARDLDPGLPECPPEMPDAAKRAIILLARRVLTLELEWS
jgi:hypothetical protein